MVGCSYCYCSRTSVNALTVKMFAAVLDDIFSLCTEDRSEDALLSQKNSLGLLCTIVNSSKLRKQEALRRLETLRSRQNFLHDIVPGYGFQKEIWSRLAATFIAITVSPPHTRITPGKHRLLFE